MSLYTIGDLHLCLSKEKPMDIFGDDWVNYISRIKYEWNKIVLKDDTVVIPGDISWATYLEEAHKDFKFIEDLNGSKIILKGNHDYWWTTHNKISSFIKGNKFQSLQFLHNNSIVVENTSISGTRGWILPDDANFGIDDNKIFKRELLRLKKSLEDAKKFDKDEIFVFMHFPPCNSNYDKTEFIELMCEYKVSKCYFGHVHGKKGKNFKITEKYNIIFQIVSADIIKFKPICIKN